MNSSRSCTKRKVNLPRGLYEQGHVWVVEMYTEIPMRRPCWSPTVGVGLDRDSGRTRLSQWQGRMPDDRFRLTKYVRFNSKGGEVKDHSEPAFPVSTSKNDEGILGHQDGNTTFQFPGMSLRDYFAIHCDQPGQAEIVLEAGLIWNGYKVWSDSETSLGSFDEWYSKLPNEQRYALYSKVRYQLADAMLKAREI